MGLWLLRSKGCRTRRPTMRSWAFSSITWLLALSSLLPSRPGSSMVLQPASLALQVCPDPVGEEADSGEDSTPEEERESESDDAVIARRPGLTSGRIEAILPGLSTAATISLRRPVRPVHFLASGRVLRCWLQSPRC